MKATCEWRSKIMQKYTWHIPPLLMCICHCLIGCHLQNTSSEIKLLPSTGEWIEEDVIYMNIYTMEYYSAVKKNELLPFATTCVNLEGLILSEINQTEKYKYHDTIYIAYMWNLKNTTH